MAQQVEDTISAKSREAGKKRLAHKLRKAGLLPAVAYGPSSPTRYLALDPKTFVAQRQAFGLSHIYNVHLENGETFKVLIKDIDQDPVSRKPVHVDFFEVDANRAIRVEVPIELTGKAAGLIEGGMLTQLLRSVEVSCLPDHVPAKIVVDVTPLGLGHLLHLSDLKLPEGVKITARGDEAVAAVVEPEAAATPTPAEAAATAGAAAAKPAAKAPGKAPAKPADKK